MGLIGNVGVDEVGGDEGGKNAGNKQALQTETYDAQLSVRKQK